MTRRLPSGGRFGPFGGQFIPETLVPAVNELEKSYLSASADPAFNRELQRYLKDYAGRPTPLYFAGNLTKKAGGAKVFFKREDLLHGGAHKINNTIGQSLLAKRMGKTRVIAETGAGQHGVATAMACAALGLRAEIYMGSEDVERQKLNVFRMTLLGATVHQVDSGSRTLKDAINEALRDWVANLKDTYYLLGSVVGPHPYPMMVRNFQSVIGREIRRQTIRLDGKLPDAVVASVGGGSNAIGSFYPFVGDKKVGLYGVEAGGEGVGKNAAPLLMGRPGVIHGMMTFVLQDANGQVAATHSISAGLDYPGVGPEHAYLKETKRANYVMVSDAEAVEAFHETCRLEGILPALESAHAIAHAMKLAKKMQRQEKVVVTLSGRGDKDVDIVAKYSGMKL